VRALITGGGGQLASDLQELLGDDARSYSHAELDIADSAALDRAFEEVGPDVVFNCAAFHNVEVCEREVDRSFEVNARAVKRLAELSAEAGARFVHLSTNYVFDGMAEAPYDEGELPNPRSIYAISKLAGEFAALSYAPDALVVRTAGLYGLHGSVSKGGNFVTRMIARAKEHAALTVVADQRLTPTFTADLAAGLITALDAGMVGVQHLTNAGETSWHGFTETFLRLAGIDVPVEAGTTVIAPGAADRPLNGVLTSSSAPKLRPWNEALADYLERAGLLAAAPA
jgi:dTDP-4-dehydrorhamnose reductase